MKLFLLSLIILAFDLSAQMQKFPLLEPINSAIPESILIEGGENELLMFWIDSTDLHMSKSLDDGTTWGTTKTLVDNSSMLESLSDLNVLKLKSGRIVVTYKQKFHYSIYSDKYDLNWSEPFQLETEDGIIRPRQVVESSLSQTADNKIWFVYNRLNIIYSLKSDDGSTWSQRDTIKATDGAARFASVNLGWDNSLVLVYEHLIDDTSKLYESISADSGKTWGNPNPIIYDEINKDRPRVTRQTDGTLWLSFAQKEPTPFEEYFQNNIYLAKLLNGTNDWSDPTKFTEYVGFDGTQNISIANNKPYITFTSDRADKYTAWYGIADGTDDSITPPEIFETNAQFQNAYPKVNLSITAKVYDKDKIDSVFFYYQENDGEIKELQLFDDGLHFDHESGDLIFGNNVLDLNRESNFNIFYTAVDVLGNRNNTDVEIIKSPLLEDGGDTFAFDNNNLWFPIDSKGVLADVDIIDLNGVEKKFVYFDESTIVYSSGFELTGYTNGQLWGNGVASASRMNDYLHGPIDSVESLNKIHVVRSSQPDFYESWVNWKDAVNQGADFYDGDGDGIYNPIDLNENGAWDTNEDKPDLLGDVTAFTIYNDGVPTNVRDFANVQPQGIEIRQTVFSYDRTTSPKLANVIFVRYKIENMGTVADKLDSVYFGAWVDMDLGDLYDDLFGTDSILNTSYIYNDGTDNDYGVNPPACFVSFIQAPPVYIDGETYIDTDGNGIYDDGIDTPLDSARNRKGELLGVDEFPGAKNNKLTASIHYFSGHPTQGDPDNETQLRNYMLGYNQQGELIDPCRWEFGEIFNEDCNSFNPSLMYSGDPVTKNGWIHRGPDDQRQLGSTGPFNLVKKEPIEILVAYIVGRGTDNLNSITEARRITNDVIGFYNTNFSYVPVGVNDKPKVQLPSEYSLSQNYPNPFNPSTTIKYSIANVGTSRDLSLQQVVLKIYDILGREITTLINKQQKAGNYEVQFDASNLTSGVYFYQLHSGSFVESKKMILLR